MAFEETVVPRSPLAGFLSIIIVHDFSRTVTVHAIQLRNTEFEGKNNAYLLDGDEIALVDTGVSTPEAEAELRAGLAEYGVDVTDLDHILLTHLHEDHIGLAGKFQRESEAIVHAHPEDEPLIARDSDTLGRFRERQRAYFDRWGMPADAQRELLAFFESYDKLRGEPAEVTTHEDGEIITLSDRRLEVVHTPGHTAGHIGYAFEDDGGPTLFAGDALLPHYTPNVGGADVRVSRPLESYLATLRRIRDIGFVRAYPGHRHPIEDPATRAQEIIDHHRERSKRIVEILDTHGIADAWMVSAELFGDLSEIHILHGPGEAYAHLHHLAIHDVLTETDGRYATNPDSQDRLDDVFAESSHQ